MHSGRAAVLLTAALVFAGVTQSEDAPAQHPATTAALPQASPGGADTPTLTVGGGKVALEGIGPTIVTPEGTLRRISNWDELSDAEREVAWRRIKARNRERLATIEQDYQAAQEAATAEQAGAGASDSQQQQQQVGAQSQQEGSQGAQAAEPETRDEL